MKNILILNDFSPEAEHATEIAMLLAGKTTADLYIWNTFDKYENPVTLELATAHANGDEAEITIDNNNWIQKLESRLNLQDRHIPAVKFIENIDYSAAHVLSIANKYNIGLLVKGITGGDGEDLQITTGELSCCTKSGCPLLLIPEKFGYKMFEKIVYATDLRFCRNEIISFLAQLAKPLNASVLVANISAKGLPYMEDTYANTVFKDTILNRSNQEHLFFSNVRERDIQRALDVLVNGMNADLLVLVNNKFHFNELLGRGTPYVIPENIHVPLLIFPS